MTTHKFADYRLLYAEVVRIVRASPVDDLGRVCEACPEWTIRQLVGHMVHTLGSDEDGGLPLPAIRDAVMSEDQEKRAAGTQARDEWTNAGAFSFGGLPVVELLSEWERLVSTEPDVGLLLIPDVAVHLYDIAETLGIEAGSRTHVMLGLGRYSAVHEAAIQARGLPPVRLQCADGDESFGSLDSDLIVSGDAYDLCRVVMGRRTPHEADAIVNWGNVPAEVRQGFPLYGLDSWQPLL